MAIVLRGALRLGPAETNSIFQRQIWDPGIYQVPLLIAGNSLFSSVWAKTIPLGASIKVRYFETTTGNVGEERVDIFEHAELTPALLTIYGFTNQGTVTPFHNKPVIEVEVLGGPCEFGVYATVVDTFASDLDAALKFDQQVFEPLEHKGIPIIGLDDTTGLFNIIRTRNGLLGVTSEVGAPWFEAESFSDSWTTNQSRDLLQFTVSGGMTRTVNTVYVSTFLDGIARLYFGSDLVGFVRTMAGAPNGIIRINPGQVAEELVDIKVTFEACEESAGAVLVDVAVYGSELNI